jgi:hypothetical protein
LRDQIERAAVSISNNIDEGFERGTHQELLTLLPSLVVRPEKCVRCCVCCRTFPPSVPWNPKS